MELCVETQSHYRIWRSRMQSFLVGEDLWDIVCGSNPIPTQENIDWRKKNGKAEFILKNSISDHLFHHILHCNSANSIWKTLNNLFGTLSDQEEARLRVLENELENTRQGDLTVSQFFSRIKNLCCEIIRVDPMEPVSEARLKCIVDHGLRPEFIPSVAVIKKLPVQIQQPSFEDYEKLLVSVEASMQTSPEVGISSEEERDLNAENQIKVEDKRKEEVMDGCALEESLLNVNKTDHSPRDDGEEILESDEEYKTSQVSTEMVGSAPEASQFDVNLYDLEMSKQLDADGEEFFTTNYEVYDSFDAMGLHKNLLRGIYAYGFKGPSAIQQQGIVPFCKGLDVIQQAQSGFGKTTVFCSGILQRLDYGVLKCQALILAPTSELARQIEKVMQKLGDYLGISVHTFLGEHGVQYDEFILEDGPGVHVVIGTPRRVLVMLQRQLLHSDYIRMFVLDEADEMLLKEFKKIYDIFRLLPPKVQVGVFSATMPPEALEITRKFMYNPARILVKRNELIHKGIKQFYVDLDEERKVETLSDLYMVLAIKIKPSIIFVNSRLKVDWLTEKMQSHDHAVSALHEGMDLHSKDTIMRGFHSIFSHMLITTDTFARGIDFQQVAVVVNYDLPTKPEMYLHRIGRTGRFGGEGVAINFVTEDDKRLLMDIQKFYNVQVKELPADVADVL